ncbi:peroxisomal membrane anchor protein conserved region-domain-containing protein [Naematelia encephala]|uniref:Peroxisomal membrane protein PEX14 n=1 Tax=Naematelia encephala TaxID=71784 RepID=A0A1Y2AZU8_9TREE|nr:peroxisomal membrane anchor protein conserved region-domain-containing protein [Naematelia encephala]
MSMKAGPSSREDLIRNAVLFLNDPKVRSSNLTSRIQFLESKGLDEAEIQEALRLAASGSGLADVPTYANGYGHQIVPPAPPRRDWRDLFIMAVISGGVVYGLTALARKYLLPHLQPPSSTSFQSTSAELSAQYDEASTLLKELQEETKRLQEGVEGERERVGKVVEEVEDAVKGVREGEERWRDELREMRTEVEGVRELVPRMIEKHAQSQSLALADLQTELRSLKTLLQSRQSNQPAPNNNGNGNGNGVSSTQAAANALLAPRAGKGIPAWQMAPSSGSGSGSGSGANGQSGSSSPSQSNGGSLSGSTVLDKESESENAV